MNFLFLMIPIYPGGFSECQIDYLFKQLRERIEYLESRDSFNEELIRLLIVEVKNLQKSSRNQEALIETLSEHLMKIENKQNNIRTTFGKHVQCYIANIRNIRYRIESIEAEIDSLNIHMSRLSIN